MGQKVHPNSFRLGVNRSWVSRWFSKKGYASILHRDITLRKAIKERLADSGIAKIEIERQAGSVKVHIFTSKPGIIIGRQGAAIENLRQELSARFGEKIEVNIMEVKKPDIDAQLIAENIASQIERRLPYRRAVKQGMTRAIENGLVGIKIRIAGRLNGSDIARSEIYKEGNIPLHTLRANVDYATVMAKTTFGAIGVKVWTYKGDVFGYGNEEEKSAANEDWLAESGKSKTTRRPKATSEAGRLEKELTAK